MKGGASAVLFVRDVRRVTRFYVGVFGAFVRSVDDRHAALDIGGFRVVVHEVSVPLPPFEEGKLPERRESGAIRLDYLVKDIVKARNEAKQHGGQIDDESPAWAPAGTSFFLGFDPEGNVFGVTRGG